MYAKSFSRRLSLLSLAITAVSLAVLFSGPASAALLSYDPFLLGGNAGLGQYTKGYTNGDGNNTVLLDGQNPANAFYGGAWTGEGNQVVGGVEGIPNLPAPSLKYPYFPRAGSSVRESDHWGNCCSVGRTGRPLANSLGGSRDPEIIYTSFLVDFGNVSALDDPNNVASHDVNNGKHGVEWWDSGIVNDSNLAVDLYVNYYAGDRYLTLAVSEPNPFEDPNNPTDNRVSQKTALGAGNLSLPVLAGLNNGTQLVVMKFEFNPQLDDPNASALDPSDDDIVTVYLNPTSSNEGDWTPAAVVAAPNSQLTISHHGAYSEFHFSGQPIPNGGYDEVRWGETFADVTPFIPEPASLTLAGLSVAGLLLSRRRK